MKKFENRRMTQSIVVIVCLLSINCNNTLKRPEASIAKIDERWFVKGKWRNGLKLKPNESINLVEFSRQYHMYNKWWNEAFNFLKTNDLKTLAPGTYVIDSANVFATVWEGIPKVKDSVFWEAHRNFNDLQYIISGKAEMGLTPIGDPNKIIINPYTKVKDIENFMVNSGDKYYQADSSSFFIFSPKEIHRPAIQQNGQVPIKKIVIKVRVPDK